MAGNQDIERRMYAARRPRCLTEMKTGETSPSTRWWRRPGLSLSIVTTVLKSGGRVLSCSAARTERFVPAGASGSRQVIGNPVCTVAIRGGGWNAESDIAEKTSGGEERWTTTMAARRDGGVRAMRRQSG